MKTSSTIKTIDAYIKLYPENVQEILQKIRRQISRQINKLASTAKEAIKYGIPTFVLNGKNLVHFAAYEKHIGFYPASEAIKVFSKELSGYETSKGTVRFYLDKPIPYELIEKIVSFRVNKNMR